MKQVKIDLFVSHYGPGHKKYFAYVGSTIGSQTLKEAKEKYYWARYPDLGREDIKAKFHTI